MGAARGPGAALAMSPTVGDTTKSEEKAKACLKDSEETTTTAALDDDTLVMDSIRFSLEDATGISPARQVILSARLSSESVSSFARISSSRSIHHVSDASNGKFKAVFSYILCIVGDSSSANFYVFCFALSMLPVNIIELDDILDGESI